MMDKKWYMRLWMWHYSRLSMIKIYWIIHNRLHWNLLSDMPTLNFLIPPQCSLPVSTFFFFILSQNKSFRRHTSTLSILLILSDRIQSIDKTEKFQWGFYFAENKWQYFTDRKLFLCVGCWRQSWRTESLLGF